MTPEEDEAEGRQLYTFGTLMFWADLDNRSDMDPDTSSSAAAQHNNDMNNASRFSARKREQSRGITLLPLACSKKHVLHFAYNDDEPSVYRIHHPPCSSGGYGR